MGATRHRPIVIAVLAVLVAAAAGTLALWLVVIRMPQPAERLPPPSAEDVAALAARLEAHVRYLAGTIGERHRDAGDSLSRAASYVDAAFAAAGHAVRRELLGDEEVFENVEVELPGARSGLVVIGAHYDTVRGSPGADDNASGVAALIELARMFAGRELERRLRFVAFVNEEYPFFMTERMGAAVHARRARERGEAIEAMLSLEMLGYFSSAAGSQHYPRPLAWFYPGTADFIAFVGDLRSRALVHRSIAAYRAAAVVPGEGIAAPQWLIEDVRRSDHAAFWAQGYPALMVTDTAAFRYPFYHTALDTPEGLDYRRMAGVVLGLAHTIERLAAAAR